MVDTKGLGKPDLFDNTEDHFRRWARSIDNLFISVFGHEFIKVLEWCLEQEDQIETKMGEDEFGSGTVSAIEDLADKAVQIHQALLSLTSGETEDLMIGAPNGFDAY